ncbi:unnamed protein product, partial [Cyprideis torosa]
FCKKQFKWITSLEGHYRVHTNERPFECDICSKRFSQSAEEEKIESDSSSEKERSPKTRKKMSKSTRESRSAGKHECAVCWKSFKCHSKLTTHERLTSKTFFVKFTYKNLRVHYRIHTNERPFECDICSKRFSTSGNLKNHTRIHTGERPHQCQLCPSAFTQSGNLTNHLRTHTGEAPFECDLCEKQFTLSSNMLRHKKKIHASQTSHPAKFRYTGRTKKISDVQSLLLVGILYFPVFAVKGCFEVFFSRLFWADWTIVVSLGDFNVSILLLSLLHSELCVVSIAVSYRISFDPV